MSTLDVRNASVHYPTPHGEPVHALEEISLSVQGTDFVVAAQEGLGVMVLNAAEFLVTDVVVTGIVIIAMIAYLFDLFMRYVERLLVPWKGKA